MSAHDGSAYQERIEAEKRRRGDERIAAEKGGRIGPEPGVMPYAQAQRGPLPTPQAVSRTGAFDYPLLPAGDFCRLDSQSTGDITDVLGEVLDALRRLPPAARAAVLAAAAELSKPEP